MLINNREPAPWDDLDVHMQKMLSFNEGNLLKVFKMLSDTMCCDKGVENNNLTSPKSPSLKNAIENLETRTILSPDRTWTMFRNSYTLTQRTHLHNVRITDSRLILYAFLPRLKKENQMRLLESCGKMLENRWFNAAQCSSIGMFQEIIRLLLEASLGNDGASRLSGIRPRRESMTDLDRFELWLNMICRIGT